MGQSKLTLFQTSMEKLRQEYMTKEIEEVQNIPIVSPKSQALALKNATHRACPNVFDRLVKFGNIKEVKRPISFLICIGARERKIFEMQGDE